MQPLIYLIERPKETMLLWIIEKLIDLNQCPPPQKKCYVILFQLGHYVPFFILFLKWIISICFAPKDNKTLQEAVLNNTVELFYYPIACPLFLIPHLYSGYSLCYKCFFSASLYPSRPHSYVSSMIPSLHQKTSLPLLYSHSTSWHPLLWFLPLLVLPQQCTYPYFSSAKLISLGWGSLWWNHDFIVDALETSFGLYCASWASPFKVKCGKSHHLSGDFYFLLMAFKIPTTFTQQPTKMYVIVLGLAFMLA